MVIKQVKNALLIFIYLVISNVAFGQAIYSGKAKGSDRDYDVIFQIYNNDSVAFCYADKSCIYAEYHGKQNKVNDTLFNVELVMDFGQFCMKDPSLDVDSVLIATCDFILTHLKNIEVEHGSGTVKMEDCYRVASGINAVKIPRKLKIGKDWASFTAIRFTNRKNLITGKPLSIKIHGYFSAFSFSSGSKISQQIVVKNDMLYFVEPDTQIGHVKLKKRK